MIHLTYNEIRSLCSDRLFRSGFLIYQGQKIEDIMQIDNTIKANVLGENDELVTIEFSSHTGNLIDSSCTCHDNILTGEPCLHIIGVLLKILYSKESLFKSLQSSNNETLLKEFESLIIYDEKPIISNQKLIKFEVTIEPKTSDKVYLSFRIGQDKLYIVQDLKEFINSLETKKSVVLSKTFTFSPDIHSFSQKAYDIIEIISDYYYSFESTKSKSHYAADNLKSSLILPDHLLLKILRQLSKETFNIKNNGLTRFNQTMLNKLTIGFEITETKADINVRCDKYNSFLFLTKNKEFLYHNDDIYHLNSTDIKTIKAITKYLVHNEIKLNKIYSDRIFSSILPTLKHIGKVKIHQDIEERFVEHKLIAKLYLDKFEESLKGTLLFCYDDVEIGIYPATKPEIDSEQILIRDLKKESQILNILKRSNPVISDEQNHFTFDDVDLQYDFIFESLPLLGDYAEIYYTDAFKQLHIENKNKISTAVKLNESTNVLEFSFDFSGVEKSEIQELLKTIKLRKKYFKLNNGSFLQLDSGVANNIINLLDTLNISSKDFEKGIIEIPKYRAIIIDDLLRNDAIINFRKNRSFSKLINDIKNYSSRNYDIPMLNGATLRDYQRIGYNWLNTLTNYGFGGILADDMGLGKTIQAISLIKSAASNSPSIVIAPTSLIYNWGDEIDKFAPDLKTCLMVGSKKERDIKLESINDYDVIITSYGLAKRDIESYLNYTFEFCIIDEAQHIKNPLSLNAKSVKLIKAKSRFALTGTPIENSLTELWSIFDFIMPGFLHTHSQFSNTFEKPIIKNNDTNAISQLTKTIEPFILRRLKKDVLEELPDKIETKITTELFDSQKKLYLAYLEQAKAELKQNSYGNQTNTIKILSILTRLRQICCHPSMFISDYSEGSAKLDLLEEIVLDAIESGHRILIFSQFTTMLNIIKERLTKNKLTYFYIDGAVNPKSRLEMVNRFNEGENDIFLISLKAGGTGLNLTGADTVIHFDPWWNPATEEQATDRAYRIGQEKSVQVFKLITTGTIEEKIYKLQQTKKDLIESIIRPGETFISSFTEQEIFDLLDYE